MKNEETKKLIRQRSKTFAAQLWDLLRNQFDRHAQESQPPSRPQEPEKITGNKWILSLLTAVPWLLMLLFAFSFFWDFKGMNATVFGYQLHFEGLLRILSISGMIGFLTNWLAITMLFRPSAKRPLLGQGLIPAQKERIAYRLARAVSDDLINPDIIKKKIHDSNAIGIYRENATAHIKKIIDDTEFRENLKKLISDYIEEMIADPEIRSSIATSLINQIDEAVQERSFEKVAFKTYRFLKGKDMQEMVESALEQLPAGIDKGLNRVDDLLDEVPEALTKNADSIEELVTSLLYKLINQLDVQALVEDNLRGYDERKLEQLIKNASNDQLRYIQYLGAVLGTFGGFLIWEPLASLLVLVSVASLLLLADVIILKIRKS